jgi:hypothetical protein
MPVIKIHNTETNEIIEREMNADELADWQASQLAYESEMQAKAELAASKNALLNKLGITEEEAKLLLS